MAISASSIRAASAFVEVGLKTLPFDKGLRALENKLRRFGSEMSLLGSKLATAGVVSLLPVGFSVAEFGRFDNQMKALKGIAAKGSASIGELTDKFKQLGRQTKFTATEVATAGKNLGKAGFDTGMIDKTIGAVVDLATATETELPRATEMVAKLLNAFRVPKDINSITKFIDQLVLTTNRSPQGLEDLFESLKNFAPQGKALGQSTESLLAFNAALAKVGLTGTLSGTQIRRIFVNLAKADKKAKLLTFGIDVDKIFAEGGDALDVLKTIEREFKEFNLSALEESGILNEIFEVRGQLAAKVFLEDLGKLARGTGEDLETFIGSLKKAEGTASKVAREIEQGLLNQFIILKSAVVGVGNEIGDALAKPLAKYTQLLATNLDLVAKWVKANQAVIQQYTLIAAAVTAAGLAMFLVASTALTLSAAVGAVAVAGQLAVAPVILLTRGFTALYQTMDTLATKMARFGTMTGRTMSAIGQGYSIGLVKTIEALGTALFGVFGVISSGAGYARKGFEQVWKGYLILEKKMAVRGRLAQRKFNRMYADHYPKSMTPKFLTELPDMKSIAKGTPESVKWFNNLNHDLSKVDQKVQKTIAGLGDRIRKAFPKIVHFEELMDNLRPLFQMKGKFSPHNFFTAVQFSTALAQKRLSDFVSSAKSFRPTLFKSMNIPTKGLDRVAASLARLDTRVTTIADNISDRLKNIFSIKGKASMTKPLFAAEMALSLLLKRAGELFAVIKGKIGPAWAAIKQFNPGMITTGFFSAIDAAKDFFKTLRTGLQSSGGLKKTRMFSGVFIGLSSLAKGFGRVMRGIQVGLRTVTGLMGGLLKGGLAMIPSLIKWEAIIIAIQAAIYTIVKGIENARAAFTGMFGQLDTLAGLAGAAFKDGQFHIVGEAFVLALRNVFIRFQRFLTGWALDLQLGFKGFIEGFQGLFIHVISAIKNFGAHLRKIPGLGELGNFLMSLNLNPTGGGIGSAQKARDDLHAASYRMPMADLEKDPVAMSDFYNLVEQLIVRNGGRGLEVASGVEGIAGVVTLMQKLRKDGTFGQKQLKAAKFSDTEAAKLKEMGLDDQLDYLNEKVISAFRKLTSTSTTAEKALNRLSEANKQIAQSDAEKAVADRKAELDDGVAAMDAEIARLGQKLASASWLKTMRNLPGKLKVAFYDPLVATINGLAGGDVVEFGKKVKDKLTSTTFENELSSIVKRAASVGRAMVDKSKEDFFKDIYETNSDGTLREASMDHEDFRSKDRKQLRDAWVASEQRVLKLPEGREKEAAKRQAREDYRLFDAELQRLLDYDKATDALRKVQGDGPASKSKEDVSAWYRKEDRLNAEVTRLEKKGILRDEKGKRVPRGFSDFFRDKDGKLKMKPMDLFDVQPDGSLRLNIDKNLEFMNKLAKAKAPLVPTRSSVIPTEKATAKMLNTLVGASGFNASSLVASSRGGKVLTVQEKIANATEETARATSETKTLIGYLSKLLRIA